jgi:hypothetical protein
MSEENPSDKSAKVPVFDGTKSKFQMWWARFKAYAVVQKFNEAVQMTVDPNLPSSFDEVIDERTEEGKAMALAKRKNSVAVAAFTMAFTTPKSFAFVAKGSSTDWPEGNANMIVKALMKKYSPQDLISRIEMKDELEKVSMKKNEDPSTLFNQIQALEIEFKKEVSLEDKLALILNKCPREYVGVISAERRTKGLQLDIDDVEEAMHEYWRSANVGHGNSHENDDDDGNSKELSMAAFSGNCNYCKQKGHMIKDCPKLKAKNTGGQGSNNTSRKFKGKCNHCGKSGHKEADCWDKPGNAGKRPAWYAKFKNRNETGNAAVSNDGETEFLMVNIDDDIEYIDQSSYCSACASNITTVSQGRHRSYVTFYDSDDESSVEEEGIIEWIDEEYDADVCKEPTEVELACSGKESNMAFPDNQKLLTHPNFWIADSAATVHMTPHRQSALNIRPMNQTITMGNQQVVASNEVADFHGRMCNKYGEDLSKGKMTGVALMKSGYNLFSVTKLMKQGWNLGGNKNSMWLEKDGKMILFDIRITTPKGMVFAMFFQREIGAAGVAKPDNDLVAVEYHEAHERLGHLGEEATKVIAKNIGWKITGTPGVCESCAVGKAKQKPLPQVSHNKPLGEGERRVHLDLSTLKPRQTKKGEKQVTISKPHWQILVDGQTQLKWSNFFATKDGMVEPTCQIFQKWKEDKRPVTHL